MSLSIVQKVLSEVVKDVTGSMDVPQGGKILEVFMLLVSLLMFKT